MSPTTTRMLPPARIVALALVALVLAGLAYLRLASGDEPVTVPEGARAGQLTLQPCRYDTEQGSYAADCGTLVVPENRHDAGSRLIALPVTRIHARSAHPAEPVFRLEGGPGKTNMEFPLASRFADEHDVVLVGYRGVDGSVRLDCHEVESAVGRSTDLLGEESFRRYGDAFRSCADRLSGDGVDLAGYSMPQQVDDLEAARRALGYDRVDLLSESAGTRLAMIYAWRHPKSIHRSVMIAVNPPGNFVWDAKTTDEQLRRYARLCAEDGSCSDRTDGLVATIRRVNADIPDRWWHLPVDEGTVRVASFYGLMESTPEAAPLSAPITLSSWLSAADGDASGFWLMSLLGDLAFPKSFVWGEMAAIGMADADTARRYYASPESRRGTILGSPGTDFIWGGGELANAWPAKPDDDAYDRVRASKVETLLVGGELDLATPPQVATKELLPYLPNGREVVLPGIGHSTSFWTEQAEAGTRLITAFLDRGRVDDSLYEPHRVDFTPEVTQTVLGKGIAAAMVGLTLLTALSLLWMPLRVHRRGRLGRRTGAALRSLYAVVLGLGGWLGGILLVVTTMPGVPLDDELLACLSVGSPIGLGIYFAWVHRDWPGATRATGLAAALGGALLGAWCGLGAAADLLSLLTAIAGAIAGGNLLLLLLDASRARAGGDEVASKAAEETRPQRLEPATPTGARRR